MIHAGNLFYLNIENRCFTPDGFATIFRINSSAVLFEKISIEKYPSSNDFTGKMTPVCHGEPVIVLSLVGRPYRIVLEEKWDCYDVYKVQLSTGEIRSVFKYNLSKKAILADDALPTN